jgi:cobalt/nickel transport system permease protein
VIGVAKIDHWAASGNGHLHRSSPTAKVVFLLLVVTAAVLSRNPYPLIVGYGTLLVVAALSGLPWSRVMVLSWYAALFALLYSLSIRGGMWLRALYIMKAITPSCAMLMLIVSTPYPKIFSLLSSALPEIIAAGLFMTYRTLFILLDMMNSFAVAIRLRGGFSPGSLYKNGANISKGIAMLLVRAVERASRIYSVMVVRGYSGSMAEKSTIRFQREDWLPLTTGAGVLLLVILWK